MTFIIKLTFILLFILFSIFLVYEEYTLSNNNVIHSSSPLYRKFKETLGLTSGIGGLYSLYLTMGEKNRALDIALKEKLETAEKLNKTEKRIRELERDNIQDKIKEEKFKEEYLKLIKEKEELANQVAQNNKDLLDHYRKIWEISNIPDSTIEEKERLTSEEHSKFMSQHAENLGNDTKNSNFINFNFNLQEFLSSLTRLELFAFISFCFNSVILSAIVSIVFIWYGDFLVKYFNLEVRYPKIAKFIAFRKKLNKYSLYYNLFLISFCAIAQLSACAIIFWDYLS